MGSDRWNKSLTVQVNYAVGGVAVQMREDLCGFNVLCTHSKGLTPPTSVGTIELGNVCSTGGPSGGERYARPLEEHHVDRS